jgi:hypothetical protein
LVWLTAAGFKVDIVLLAFTGSELNKPADERVSAFGNFLGLQTLRAFYQSELYFLPFIKAAIPIALNRPKVHKDIVWPVGHSDKTKTFGVVEPLNGSYLAV